MPIISKRSRGSVNDMLAAMKDELQQNVDSSTAVEGSINYKGYIIEYNKEFKSYDIFDDYDLPYAQDVPSIADAKSKIDQEVDASTSIDGPEIMCSSEIDIEYIAQVEQAVLDSVRDEVDDIVFQEADDALYCTISYNDHITNFEIPYDDLYFTDVDLDASYIANSIIEAIEEALGHRDNE